MISICIPTYNNLAALQRCLDSVWMQDHKDYEVVICDDSTGAETEEYINSLNRSEIRYYRNSVALGSPANWNLCIRKAQGDYIKILHHDDFFSHKGALSAFHKASLSNPEACFIFSDSTTHFIRSQIYSLNQISRTQLKRIRKQPEFLFFRNCIGSPSVTMFKKTESTGFDVRFKWLVDVEFYIRMLKADSGFIYIPEALLTISDGEEGQITQSVIKNRELILGENLLLFSNIYAPALNTKASLEYFAELFLSFEIYSYEKLVKLQQVPEKIDPFVREVFSEMKRHVLWKRLKKRFLTSRYNKLLFQIERF